MDSCEALSCLPLLTMTSKEFYKNYISLKNIQCNCGGPEDGTDHSPDCSLILEEYNIQDEWNDLEENDKKLSVKQYNKKYHLQFPKENTNSFIPEEPIYPY